MEPESENVIPTIDHYESILKDNPQDLAALEFLADAHEQDGDLAKSLNLWTQFTESALQASDNNALQTASTRLEPYTHEPSVVTLISEIQAKLDTSRTAANGDSSKGGAWQRTTEEIRLAGTFEEMNLAWLLHERGLLDIGEYEELTSTLTESGTQLEFPVSALHCLHRLHPDRSDSAVLLLSDASKLTPIRLDVFEPNPQMLEALPGSLARSRGVFVFGRVGDVMMVALLNPLDAALREEIEVSTGLKCQFFIAHPSSIDAMLAWYPAQ